MRKPAQPGARRRSQAKGAVWERCVSEWLKRLKAAGVLTVFHKLEPTKIGERFVKDAGADFVCCTSSGSYIAIECKQTKDRRFMRSQISAVQVEHLDAVPRSFLALLIDSRRFLIPWQKVPWVTLRSADGVSADDCAIWEVRGSGLSVIEMRLGFPDGE